MPNSRLGQAAPINGYSTVYNHVLLTQVVNVKLRRLNDARVWLGPSWQSEV